MEETVLYSCYVSSCSVNITFCSSDQNIRCKNARHMTDDTSERCIHF